MLAHFTQSPSDQRARDLLLSGQRQLLVPHLLLLMARLALLHGSTAPAGDHQDPREVARHERMLLDAMLITAHHAGSRMRSGGVPLADPKESGAARNKVRTISTAPSADPAAITAMDLELAANILANRKPFAASTFDRSQRRWIEIPAEDVSPKAVDLAAEFQAATGVPFEDLRMVEVAL